MSHRLEELVDTLAHIALEEHLDDPERLVELMAERETLISAIQCTDASELSEPRRAELKQRIRDLLARDAAVLTELEERRVETQQALAQLNQGRAAVRGYGSAVGEETMGVRRIG